MNPTDLKPIDAPVTVPPPGKDEDTHYLTRDITSALERAIAALVARRAAQLGLGRRQAAVRVLAELGKL